jgi:PAS domain S-box-containing protein
MAHHDALSQGKTYHDALEGAIDAASIGLCVCDGQGVIHSINDTGIAQMAGPSKRRPADVFTGSNIARLHDDLNYLYTRASGGEYITNHEISISRQGDDEQWVLVDAHPCLLPEGGSGVLFLSRNISYHKHCEIELKRSQTKLTSIVDTIPDIVYRVDPQGIITFINSAVREYGYTPEELIGTNFLELVHPDDRDKARYRINERRTGVRKTRQFEIRLFSKQKEVISFELKSSNLKGEQVFMINSEGIYITSENDRSFFIGTQGIARDVTRKKRIERELFESKEKWVSILNSLEDGYYEVDLDGNFIFVNGSFCAMTGYSYDEMIGSNYRRLFGSDDCNAIFKTFNDVFKTGEQAKLLNWIVIRRDGKKRNVEGSVSLSRDIDGASNGFRGIVRDATDKIKIEQELLRARKLEAIGILAGGIAHDYNNALTAIMGNISLAKMELETDQGLMDILNDAEKASMKVMELTKRLSSFSKGGRPIKRRVSMASFLKDTIDSILYHFSGKYELSIPDDLWEVELDEIQISHAIEHIVNNAVEAVGSDGCISVTARNIAVYEEESHHEITLQPGNFVVISVSDNGPGIPSGVIDNIFDPYFSTKEFASGMGLATSYAIIKRHRGYIDVRSEEGRGATFHVYLPVQE